MDIRKVGTATEKATITSSILSNLPEWFGISASTNTYIENSKEMEMWACYDDNQPVGFVVVKQLFVSSAEIDSMGILKTHQGKGIGTALVDAVKKQCKKVNISFLQVKTLSSSHPDKYYKLTRSFYSKIGFFELEEFPDLWGKSNPCLQMIMKID